MDLKKIFCIDAYKVLIILILLLYPFIGITTSTSTIEGETSYTGEHNFQGLPFTYLKFEYKFDEHADTYVPRLFSNLMNFVLDIIVAYLIGVIIAFGYYNIKKK